MKIILFLKSRITVAIIIQRIFLLCIIFKKIGDRDCRLSIWRQGAQGHVSWNYAASTDRRMTGRPVLLGAIRPGRPFSVFSPGKGKPL